MLVSLLIGSFVSYAILIGLLVLRRPVSKAGLLGSLGVLLVTTAIALVNLRFGIIEQKFASEFAFDWYNGDESERPNRTFAVQAIANAPAFFVAGSWHAAIGTNTAVTAAVYAFMYDTETKAHRYFLGPAVINFALFSLRDPFIGLILMGLVLSFGKKFELGRLPVPIVLAAVAMFWTRPENLLIILALVWFLGFRSSKSALTKLALIMAGAFGAVVALRFAPALLGVQGGVSIGNLPAFFVEFSEDRGTRTNVTGVGGGSDILGGALQRMPIFFRYPIQLFTFFVLPLPFEIRSVALLLSAVDSLFFAYGARKLFKEGSYPAKLLFAIYVLVAAFFSSNYGNVFRIRYPLYFVIGAGLLTNKGEKTLDLTESTKTRKPAGQREHL